MPAITCQLIECQLIRFDTTKDCLMLELSIALPHGITQLLIDHIILY